MLYSLAMSVYIDGKSWNGPIPYVFAVDVANREWAETWIEHFNRRGAKEIFIPREKASAGLAADYVVFVETGVKLGESTHGESPIGRQGGEQKVMFHKSNSPAPAQYTILHEMGHCVGLGHEQYNPKWIFRYSLSEIHSSNYEKQISLYRVFQNGECDYASIMMYSLAAFGITEERLRKKITPAPTPVLSASKLEETRAERFLREQAERDAVEAERKRHRRQFEQESKRYFTIPSDLSSGDVALIQHLYPNVKSLS